MEHDVEGGTASGTVATGTGVTETSSSARRNQILQRYWDQGMKNVRSEDAKQLMQRAVAETGLTVTQVKTYITNKKQKENNGALKIYKQRTGSHRRLYDVFMSKEFLKLTNQSLSKSDKMSLAHSAWLDKRGDPAVMEELRKELEEQRRGDPCHLLCRAAESSDGPSRAP